MSDILGRGTSSRLYQELILEKEIFNDITAYMTGNLDPGLLVLSGQVKEGTDLKFAEEALNEVLLKVRNSLNEKELQKVKNKAISTYAFEQVGNAEIALNLAYWELIENAELASSEISRIESVSMDEVITEWDSVLVPENSSTLFYKAI
jgi:predicted Zn-dependent peptidase